MLPPHPPTSKTSAAIYPLTMCNIPEYFNLCLKICDKLRALLEMKFRFYLYRKGKKVILNMCVRQFT